MYSVFLRFTLGRVSPRVSRYTYLRVKEDLLNCNFQWPIATEIPMLIVHAPWHDFFFFLLGGPTYAYRAQTTNGQIHPFIVVLVIVVMVVVVVVVVVVAAVEIAISAKYEKRYKYKYMQEMLLVFISARIRFFFRRFRRNEGPSVAPFLWYEVRRWFTSYQIQWLGKVFELYLCTH